MSEALVRSLNLPAVQVLEAYGPKRFAAKLRNVGLHISPTVLRRIFHSFSAALVQNWKIWRQRIPRLLATARQAELRLQPDDPLLERPLMSSGAAWIIRRIMADEAKPLPDSALPRVAPLAWKTGTSYGYRDAWAIGVNARYVIGIWTGRPDGTPVVGQFGFASAVPLLNQVNNILLSRSANLPETDRTQSLVALSAGRADRLCRKVTVTVAAAWQPGCWTGVAANSITARSRKALMAFVSPSGWMKIANVLPLIARKRDKK